MEINNNNPSRKRLIIILLIILLITYIIPVVFPQQTFPYWQEDGVIENMGAMFFLIASIFLFITFFRLRKKNSVSNKFEALWILALSLLFFVAFGEEISWGQRIFNFATPESVRELNEQHEFNIHNLKPFHGLDEDGNHKTGLAALITSHRLFYGLLIGYIIILPLIMLSKNWLTKLIYDFYIPISPLWIASIFFAVLFITKLTQYLFARNNPDLYHGLVEIMETNIAFVTSLLGFSFYKSYSKKA